MNAKTVHLVAGPSRGPEEGACLEQLVSLLAGEPFGDTPVCADVMVIRWGMHVNDSADDLQRADLYSYAVRQIGTADDGRMDERALACCDWTFRTVLPDALDWEGYTAEAKLLRATPEIDTLARLMRAVDETMALVIRPEAAIEWALSLVYEIAEMVAVALPAEKLGERIPYCDHPGRTKIELYADVADMLAELAENTGVLWEKRLDLLDRMLPPEPTFDFDFERCEGVPGLEALAR